MDGADRHGAERSGRLALPLPELDVLLQHVDAAQHRHDQARRAVAEAAARDVVAQEGRQRMQQQVPRAGLAALRVHLRRRQGRVVVHAREVFGDIGIRAMLDLAAKVGDVALTTSDSCTGRSSQCARRRS